MKHTATTYQARCQQVAAYLERYRTNPAGFWLGLGKLTPWADDSNPPFPATTTNRIPELYGFWYVHTCLPIYADTNGLIVTSAGNYSYIESTAPTALASAKANKLYLETIIQPQDFANQQYRCKGLCTDISFYNPPLNPGVGTFVPVANVSGYFLDWLSYHTPVTHSSTTTEVIQLVREF